MQPVGRKDTLWNLATTLHCPPTVRRFPNSIVLYSFFYLFRVKDSSIHQKIVKHCFDVIAFSRL